MFKQTVSAWKFPGASVSLRVKDTMGIYMVCKTRKCLTECTCYGRKFGGQYSRSYGNRKILKYFARQHQAVIRTL